VTINFYGRTLIKVLVVHQHRLSLCCSRLLLLLFHWFVKNDVHWDYLSRLIPDWFFLHCVVIDGTLTSIILIGWKLDMSLWRSGSVLSKICLHGGNVDLRASHLFLFYPEWSDSVFLFMCSWLLSAFCVNSRIFSPRFSHYVSLFIWRIHG